MNTGTHTIDVLILIADILDDFGVGIIVRSAEIYEKKTSFFYLLNFLFFLIQK
jgi:hypothetical protein